MAASTPSKQRLTWLITGCSSGFGLSLTRTIIAAGRHTVIATSRNPSRTPGLVAEVEASGGRWLTLDVAEPDNASKLVAQLEGEGHEIDVLVNNAGFCTFSPVETATDSEMRQQMEVMFFGPLRLIQAVLPYMRKRRNGVVVNFSSGASLMGTESMGIYAGAKGGLDATTRVLGKEVAGFNIRTLSVVLGTFNTNLSEAAPAPSVALPEDYKDTMPHKVMQAISSGTLKPNGDKDKAMRAVYDVVVGEGPGKGHEDERFLPLGTDMDARVGIATNFMQHGLEVFRETTNGVSLDQ